MSQHLDIHRCLSCQQPRPEPSVIRALCRECVARLGHEFLAELQDTTGAVHEGSFRLDDGMLGHAGISTADDAHQADGHLDLDDAYQSQDCHRLRLLWVLAAEVDRLRGQLAEAEAGLSAARHQVRATSTTVHPLATEHQRVCRELEASSDELRRLERVYDELESAHGQTLFDLEVGDARAGHLAAIARRSLLVQHRSGGHRGPLYSCLTCAGDWAVATATVQS